MRSRSAATFFVLVFALSVPFWLVSARTDFQLLPGLPLAALMFVCPVTAASVLSYRENGTAGVAALMKRAFDYKRIPARLWYVPTVLLSPGLMLVSYGVVRASGVPLPLPQLPVLTALGLLGGFFVGGLAEELGWSGYAIDPLQDRWGALPASILVGFVWAAWHLVPLHQAHRSPGWIAWWCLGTVTLRVLLVWLYNGAGKSVFAAATCHAMSNLNWMAFPVYGSHFDPRISGPVTACAAVVVVAWGDQARGSSGPGPARFEDPFADLGRQ